MLKTTCLAVSEITPAQKMEMFRLMDAYYANVTWDTFLDDLENKQRVLCLRAANNQLVGFSTQKVFDYFFEGENHRIVFSGDTIIDKTHRGSQALAWAFGRFMWEIHRQQPTLPLYWLLTTKGVRTYRFLPLYFLEFYPRFDRPTPSHYALLMNKLGTHVFPDRYDSKRGVLLAKEGSQRMRDFDIVNRDSTNKHCLYFSQQNPDYRQGEELLCVTQFSSLNVTPRVWQAIERYPSLLSESSPLSNKENFYASLVS